MHKISSQRGFTIIELMIVVALLAIVAAIAIPNFTQFIRNNQVQAKTEEVYALFQYARSQAVAARKTYSINLGTWEVSDAAGTVERKMENNNSQIRLVGTPDSISFDGRGMVRDARSATVNIFHTAAPDDGYVVEVRSSGMVRKNKAG